MSNLVGALHGLLTTRKFILPVYSQTRAIGRALGRKYSVPAYEISKERKADVFLITLPGDARRKIQVRMTFGDTMRGRVAGHSGGCHNTLPLKQLVRRGDPPYPEANTPP